MKQERMSADEFRQQFGGKPQAVASGKMRLPRTPKMTYAEATYERMLRGEFPDPYEIRFERLTLILDSGTRYTPDFSVWFENKIVLCVEVKGRVKLKSFDRAATKFKEAITSFPNITFRHAFLTNGNEWIMQEKRLNNPPK